MPSVNKDIGKYFPIQNNNGLNKDLRLNLKIASLLSVKITYMTDHEANAVCFFTLLTSTSEFPMTFAQRDGDGVKL